LLEEGCRGAIAPELAINSDTPPTFLMMAQDHPIRVENVLGYSWALRQAVCRSRCMSIPAAAMATGCAEPRRMSAIIRGFS